jgi:hypothetical protein
VVELVGDSEYAVLLDALRWIEDHAGVDAPEYPGIRVLADVVDSLGRRQKAGDVADEQKTTLEGRTGLGGSDMVGAGRQRNRAADLRDERGATRDKIADLSDVVADNRDTRAILHREYSDADSAFRSHRDGARDRTRAATDREASAADREASARDRQAAARDLEAEADNGEQGIVET